MAGVGGGGFADGRAGDAFNVAFHPPSIENAQTGHPIQRGFHSAGAGSLERKLRRVEPEVHAGSYLSAKLEIVVVEENHGHGFPQRFFRMENPPNYVFPTGIIRVGLAGIDNLEMAGILDNLPETIEIGQDQVAALVSRCAPPQTNPESLTIKFQPRLLPNRLEQIV